MDLWSKYKSLRAWSYTTLLVIDSYIEGYIIFMSSTNLCLSGTEQDLVRTRGIAMWCTRLHVVPRTLHAPT